MASRTSWEGYLRLNLLSVPVKAYNASVTGKGKIGFHLIHSKCNNRIRYQKVSEDVRKGAERASHQIRRGAERARETYDDVAENAQKTYHRVRSEAGNLSREVSLYVRDNPAKSLLIAAGVGFLLGLVVRGRGGQDDEE